MHPYQPLRLFFDSLFTAVVAWIGNRCIDRQPVRKWRKLNDPVDEMFDGARQGFRAWVEVQWEGDEGCEAVRMEAEEGAQGVQEGEDV